MNIEDPTKKEEQPKVLTMEDIQEVLDAIEQLEGPTWRERQEDELAREDEEPRHHSLRAAIVRLNKLQEDLERFKKELLDEKDSENIKWLEEDIADYESGNGPKTEIYGEGGVSRYFVLSNGEITISESHMSLRNKKERLEKAKQLGIKVVY